MFRSKFSEVDFLTTAAAAGTVISNGSTIEGRITSPNTISVSGLVKGELNSSEIVIEKDQFAVLYCRAPDNC